MSKHTPWFNIKTTCPDKPGVYEVLWGDGSIILYSLWDGRKWYATAAYRHRADAQTEVSRWAYDGTLKSWRGLSKPPKD